MNGTWHWVWQAVYVFHLLTSVVAEPPQPQTTVAQGRLEGKWMVTRGGRTVAAFLAMPYAQPPVGHLRFKSPQPPKAWNGVLLANKDAPGCIQPVSPPIIPAFYTPLNSEDCLYINVYTPNLKPDRLLPVLVFIYGGSYEIGSAQTPIYGPDYLLDQDIILATFNYRLGILGFLSLDDTVLPGNLGLKDQRAALQWLNTNIAQFGGDPGRVTVSGESAGGISANFQIIAAPGFFKGGIFTSSTARSIWELQSKNPQKELVEKLIEKTKCPRESNQLLNCLRLIPAHEFPSLLNYLAETPNSVKRRAVVLQPVIEPDCVEDAIITTNPWNTTISIPILQGANDLEGIYVLAGLELEKSDERLAIYDKDYKTILPYNLFFEKTAENPAEVAEMLKRFYFPGGKIDRQHFLNLVDLVSDAMAFYPLVKTARANEGVTFFYRLNYKGANTVVRFFGSDNYYGAAHSDELYYLFPMGGSSKRNITECDTALSKLLVNMFANFITYSDPTPNGIPIKWFPVKSPSIEYLNIGQHNFMMEFPFYKNRVDFWDNLPFRSKIQPGRKHCAVCN